MTNILAGKRRRTRNAGFSLIELMIAMLVLVVGLLGGMIVILTAIATNARNRFDTAEIALAQSTMDRILVLSASSVAQSTDVTDCNGVVHTMNTTGSDAGSGAPLTTLANINNGNQIIDFSQPAVAGYQMLYTLCAAGGAGTIGNPQVYDVRWNIQNIANTNQNAQLVLVGAKNVNEGNNGFSQTRLFNLPVTLRGVRGN